MFTVVFAGESHRRRASPSCRIPSLDQFHGTAIQRFLDMTLHWSHMVTSRNRPAIGGQAGFKPLLV